MVAHVPALPTEIWGLVCEHLRACDLIEVSGTCQELNRLAGEEASDVWQRVFNGMCTAAVTSLAGSHADNRIVLDVCARALMLRELRDRPGPFTKSPRKAFFYAAPHVAEAAVFVVARNLPSGSPQGACVLISLDRRAYDVSDYVEHHPGGVEYLLEHHGKDASAIFNSHSHSTFAHDLMKHELMRFDGVAHVGRIGAPRFARGSISHMSRWSFAAEASDFFSQAADQYGPSSLLEWWKHGPTFTDDWRSGLVVDEAGTRWERALRWLVVLVSLGGWAVLYHVFTTVVFPVMAALHTARVANGLPATGQWSTVDRGLFGLTHRGASE